MPLVLLSESPDRTPRPAALCQSNNINCTTTLKAIVIQQAQRQEKKLERDPLIDDTPSLDSPFYPATPPIQASLRGHSLVAVGGQSHGKLARGRGLEGLDGRGTEMLGEGVHEALVDGGEDGDCTGQHKFRA